MPLLLSLTAGDPRRDPRARRAVAAARAAGLEVVEIGRPARVGTPHVATRLHRELRGAGRLARLVRTTLQLLFALRREGKRPQIVHAHDLDTLLAGWLITRRTGARLVYDAHELYTGFDVNPPRIWLRVIAAFEGLLARRSSAVVTVSDGIADELARRHRLSRRPFVVLNCPLLSAGGSPDRRTGALRVIYQAAAGPGRNLDDLGALVPLENVEVSARVLGDDHMPDGVHRLEPVDLDQLVAALEPFDVGLVIDRPTTENARLALPNKLFEYLMAGLAVVVPDAPTMAALVENDDVGRVYPADGLVRVVAALAADRGLTDTLRRRAREAALERYNAEAQRPALYAAWGL
jgi:glycosyltransferase involved in cell wall biosynthesis